MKSQRSFQLKSLNQGNISPCLLQQKSLSKFAYQKYCHQKLSKQFLNVQQQYYTPKYQKIKYFCKNHKKISATHFIMTGDKEKIVYCQKCSILIASQGFTVTKLINQNLNNFNLFSNKKKAQKQFSEKMKQKIKEQKEKLQRLEYLIFKNQQQIFLLTQQIKNVVNNLNVKYQKKVQELSHVFIQVFQFLKAQKERCFETLQKQFEQLKTPLQNYQKYFHFSKDYLSNFQSKISTSINNNENSYFSSDLFHNISKSYEAQFTIFVNQKNNYKTILQDKLKNVDQQQLMKLSDVKHIVLNVIYKFFQVQSLSKNSVNNNEFQTVIKELCVKTDPFSFGNQNAWTPTSSITKKQTVSPNDLNKSLLFQLNNIGSNDIQRSKIMKLNLNDDSNIFKNISQIENNKKQNQSEIVVQTATSLN